jgi:WD40 repeat protein
MAQSNSWIPQPAPSSPTSNVIRPGSLIMLSSANELLIATWGADNCTRVWRLPDGKPVCPPLQHQDQILCAAFNSDNERLITGTKDGRTCIWDLRTGRLELTLRHQAPVNYASFTPSGKQLVTLCSRGFSVLGSLDWGTALLLHTNLLEPRSCSSARRATVS